MAKRKHDGRKVVFRRIRGRIVPIRVKVSDVALMAGGASVAIGGAVATGSLLKSFSKTQDRVDIFAKKTYMVANKQLDMGFWTPKVSTTIKRGEKAARYTTTLRTKTKFAVAGVGITSLLGSFVAQRGAERMAKRFGASETEKDIAGGVVAAGFSIAVGSILLGKVSNPKIRRFVFRALRSSKKKTIKKVK